MVVSKKKTLAYEESRLKTLEENKKRMDELNLSKFAQAVSSHKSSAMKNVKPRVKQAVDHSAVRRSNRVADNKLGVKKTATPTKKDKKAAKDPNKPKRPASAFFVFMEEFRKTYKEKHPNNKSVAAVGKAGGDKWKSLTEAEKKPYQDEAEKRKEEYDKNKEAYNRRQAGEADEEESDKSKSEVDEEDGSGEEDEDDD